MQERLTTNDSELENFEEIKIYTTKDYSLFKTLDGNRSINHLHLARLRKSMKKNLLTTIIQVNENFEIIDGQHRFLVCKELDLPLHYIISKKYGLNEVQILNANMQNWQISDYVNGYADLGYENYVIYRQFVKDYAFQASVSILLLSGVHNSGNGEVSATTRFKDGLFKVKSLSDAKDMANKLKLIEPYYTGYNKRFFVVAMYSMFKNKNFDFQEFVSKLKLQPTALKPCANITQYKSLIEDIYNYRRRDKVNLRF